MPESSQTIPIGSRGYDYRHERTAPVQNPYPDRLIINPYSAAYTHTVVAHATWYGSPTAVGAAAGVSVPRAQPVPLASVVSGLMEKWTQSEFNAGVAIAEGRESAELIIQRAVDLRKAVKALRKGSVGGALRYLKGKPTKHQRRRAAQQVSDNAANAWLELRYGWIPMYSDIYNAAELIKPKPVVTNIRMSKQNTLSASAEGSELTGPYTKTATSLRGTSAYCRCYREPTWAERLGLTDPLTIAWELVPFSFAVDWILPIGDTIQANYVRTAIPIQSSGYSVLVRDRVTKTVRPPSYVTITGSPLDESCSLTRYVGLGSVLDDLADLGQRVTPKWDTTLKRTVDITSLLQQDLSSLRRAGARRW